MFYFSQKMKYVGLKEYGDISNLIIKETDIPQTQQDEVLLKVKGFAINRADTVQRKGKYPAPKGASQILGLEAFGSIVNEDPETNYCALLSGGGYAEYVNVHKDHLIKLPKEIDVKNAPGLAEVWLTAYQIMMQIGQFKKGQNILIYAGASGVGTSAIQLANYFTQGDCNIFYTVSNQQKLQFCQDLGGDFGINYKEMDNDQIIDYIKSLTNGKGVDVILDCVGASNAKLSSQVIGLDGRWIQFGLQGGFNVENFSLATILQKRVSLIGTTLRTRDIQYKSNLVSKFTQEVIPGFQSNQLKFIVDKNYDFDWSSVQPIQDAHQYMESNQSIGKIQININ